MTVCERLSPRLSSAKKTIRAVGVPSNFGDHRDQVYLVPQLLQLAVFFSLAIVGSLGCSPVILARFKGKRKKIDKGNGRNMGGAIAGDGGAVEEKRGDRHPSHVTDVRSPPTFQPS